MIYPNFKREKINIFLDLGGIGDNIARMPAIKYIIERHPHIDPVIWIPDYFLPLAKNLYPNALYKTFSQGDEYEEELPARSTGIKSVQNLKIHMTQHAFITLASELAESKDMNYLSLNTNPIAIKKFNLPDKYVVVTTGFTAPIREWLPEYINEVVSYIKSKGYKVVFLGSNQTHTGVEGDYIIGNFREEINYNEGINLINKTSLLEAGKILAKSQCVVGLDNGILHLAACSEVPIVYAFTSVMPQHRLPYRHNEMGWNIYPVVPPENQPERFCQSIWDFCFGHDFKFSYYENNDLIKSVTPNLYIEQLERIL